MATADLFHIDQALGQSVVYEELKGNFAAASEAAERALVDARRTAHSDAIADALLACGTVRFLQGETRAAIACLDEVGSMVPGDAVRLRKAAALRRAAAYVQFDFFPDGGPGYGPEVWVRLDEIAIPSGLDLQVQALPLVTYLTVPLQTSLIGLIPKLIVMRGRTGPELTGDVLLLTQQLLRAVGTDLDAIRQLAIRENAPLSVVAAADLLWALLCRGPAPEAALEILQRAQQTYQNCGDDTGDGICRMYRADWRVAPSSTPLALNYVVEERVDQANDWIFTGPVMTIPEAEVEVATGEYDEAERLFRKTGALRGLAAIELRRAYLAALGHDYRAAVYRSQLARRGFAEAGDRLGEWLSAAHWVLARVGAREEPEDLDTATAIGTWGANTGSFSFCLGIGLLMSRVGGAWLRHGDYERALGCHRLARSVFLGLGAAGNVAQALVDEGTALRLVGDRDSALNLYADADRLCREQLREPRASIQRQAAAWVRAAGVTANVFQVYLTGMEVAGMDRTARRMKELIDSPPAEISGVIGQQYGATVSLLRNLLDAAAVFVPTYQAVAGRDAGDAREAEKKFEEALVVARKQKGPEALQRQAMVLGYQHRYPEAAAAYKRFLDSVGDGIGILAEQLGADVVQKLRSQQEQAKREEAAALFCRVQAYQEASDELAALEMMADAERLNQMDHDWNHQWLRGQIAEGMRDLPSALQHYDRALEMVEAGRQLLLDDQLRSALGADSVVQRLYFYAARAAHDRGGPSSGAASFAYAERGKSRALLDLIASTAETAVGATRAQSEPNLAPWREQSARTSLASRLVAEARDKKHPSPNVLQQLMGDLALQQARLHEITQQLAASYPDFAHVLGKTASTMSAAEVAAALAPDEALLEYFYLESQFVAFAVTHDGTIAVKTRDIDAAVVDRKIRQFQSACKQFDDHAGELTLLGAELADWFLDPFATVIDQSSHLTIVPYGTSHLLPFHALPWRGGPLIGCKSVSYLPSASALRFLRASSDTESLDPVLAIASPGGETCQVVPGQHRFFPVLTAATAEVAYIREHFPSSTLLGPGGADATAEMVRTLAPQYRSLHFAAHCCVSSSAPLATFILLANGERLSLYNLVGMRLKSRLVVLSACSSGIGEITRGDDVLGLTRGLLAAGARTAVVTLWDLNDDSTAVLMAIFYDRLKDNLTPARALQAAQNELRSRSREEIQRRIVKLKKVNARDVKLLNNYEHPYYWAPFTLVG